MVEVQNMYFIAVDDLVVHYRNSQHLMYLFYTLLRQKLETCGKKIQESICFGESFLILF